MVFQNWFHAAAEEASEVSRVTVYMKEVKKATPSLLAFLVNLADDNGNTVLHYSVSHCNYDIVSLLLETGTFHYRSVKTYHRSVLSVNILSCLQSLPSICVDRATLYGNICRFNTEIMEFKLFLYITGVSDVNLQNKAGYTAAMLASLTAPDGPGGMEVVRKLMELGNINIRSSQVTRNTAQIQHEHRQVNQTLSTCFLAFQWDIEDVIKPHSQCTQSCLNKTLNSY